MANIVLRESFDNYANVSSTLIGLANQWPSVFGGYNESLQLGRFGTGQSLQSGFASGTTYAGIVRAFDEHITEGVVAMAFKPVAGSTSGYKIIARTLDASGAYHLGLVLGADGSINVVRMSARYNYSAVLASSAPSLIIPGAFNHLAFGFEHAESAAHVTIYHNGNPTPVASVSGLDTRNGGDAFVSALSISTMYLGTQSDLSGQYDDIYVTDNIDDYLGDLRIDLYPFTGDGGNLDFTPNSGSAHFSRVNETLADSSTYLQGTTPGDYDELTFTGMTNNPTNIHECNIIGSMVKLDSAARAIALGIDSNGTVEDGVDHYLAATQSFYRTKHALDPDTAAPWTKTKVNGIIGRPIITV